MIDMSDTTTLRRAARRPTLTGTAERRRVLDLLRGSEPWLRRRGVRRLRLFGSVARGEAGLASDIDLIAEVDHDRVRFSLVDLVGLEQELGELLGRSVQVTTVSDAMRAYIRRAVERDAIEVF
jgi:predicted nucleotidyltransferase